MVLSVTCPFNCWHHQGKRPVMEKNWSLQLCSCCMKAFLSISLCNCVPAAIFFRIVQTLLCTLIDHWLFLWIEASMLMCLDSALHYVSFHVAWNTQKPLLLMPFAFWSIQPSQFVILSFDSKSLSKCLLLRGILSFFVLLELIWMGKSSC